MRNDTIQHRLTLTVRNDGDDYAYLFSCGKDNMGFRSTKKRYYSFGFTIAQQGKQRLKKVVFLLPKTLEIGDRLQEK